MDIVNIGTDVKRNVAINSKHAIVDLNSIEGEAVDEKGNLVDQDAYVVLMDLVEEIFDDISVSEGMNEDTVERKEETKEIKEQVDNTKEAIIEGNKEVKTVTVNLFDIYG